MTETARRSFFPPVSVAEAGEAPQAQDWDPRCTKELPGDIGWAAAEPTAVQPDWAQPRPSGAQPDMADTQPIQPVTSSALAEQCQRVSAKVMQLGCFVEERWARGEDKATAVYEAKVAELDAQRNTSHAQIAEISAALDGFAELVATRRGEIDSKLQSAKQNIATHVGDIQGKEIELAELEREAAMLSESTLDTQGNITLTEAKIAHFQSQINELVKESIAIDEAAEKRRAETGAIRLKAQQQAGHNAEQVESAEEVTEILQGLVHVGAGPEGVQNDTHEHQRDDRDRQATIKHDMTNLVSKRDGYVKELEELKEKDALLLQNTEENTSEISEVSVALARLSRDLEKEQAKAAELLSQSEILQQIEGLELDAIKPERITDALLAPYNGALRLRDALEKGMTLTAVEEDGAVLTTADELSSEGTSEGSAVHYGDSWSHTDTSFTSFVPEMTATDTLEPEAGVEEIGTRPDSPFAEAMMRAKDKGVRVVSNHEGRAV